MMVQAQCVPAHGCSCIVQWSSPAAPAAASGAWLLLCPLPPRQPTVLLMPLQVLDSGLSATGLPYSYGFAIITLTILVKVATFPLSKKQVCAVATRCSSCESRPDRASASACWCTQHALCRLSAVW